MCHNRPAAAAHRPRMDGPNRTACRPPVSIGEESLARDSELSVESQIVEQPAILGLSLSSSDPLVPPSRGERPPTLPEPTKACCCRCAVSLKKSSKNVAEIFIRVTTSDCQRVHRVNTFLCIDRVTERSDKFESDLDHECLRTKDLTAIPADKGIKPEFEGQGVVHHPPLGGHQH